MAEGERRLRCQQLLTKLRKCGEIYYSADALRQLETRETADHSLPYMLAVALTDGRIGPPDSSPGGIWIPACDRS